MITSAKIGVKNVVEIFNLLNAELKKIGVLNVIYKPVPLIYHHIPSQEDIYALFLNKAEMIGCNISSVIFQNNKLRFSELRRRGIKRSNRLNLQITESTCFSDFYTILEDNLVNKYGTKPVHSLQELELLNRLFPENIKLYLIEYLGIIIAGTILYVMSNIVRVQYICANETGKTVGALDLLFDNMINEKYQHIPYFDFGQSTESMGNYLNENLIFQKEGFGGRGIVYEIFKYNL